MSEINETHPLPIRHASVGHEPVHLLGSHTGPQLLDTPKPAGLRKHRRAQAKATLAARRSEAQSGADFLRSIVTARGGER